MQQEHCKILSLPKSQQGVTLIEVLISIVLMAIIGLGGAFIAGRTAVIHRDQNIHLHTIGQLRQQLENSTQCGSKSTGTHSEKVKIVGKEVQVDCTVKTQAFTVDTFNNSNPKQGVAASTVNVSYAEIKISADDSFVPIKVQISP